MEDRGYRKSEGIHGCDSGGDFSVGHVECDLLVMQAVEVCAHRSEAKEGSLGLGVTEWVSVGMELLLCETGGPIFTVWVELGAQAKEGECEEQPEELGET